MTWACATLLESMLGEENRPLSLGRYILFEKIASGGMATIHVGRLRTGIGFDRTVAIKRLRSHCTRDPEFVAMFLDEARLASRIRHPNILNTLDVVSEQGELFLVLEYAAGEVCSRLFDSARERKTPIPLPIMSAIMCGTLAGLHAAHEARDENGELLNLVHRDVTPHNIMVDVDGVPRVLDWGIAKAAGRLHETRKGEIKGKPAFMAPEQLNGSEITRRADIYAACAVMWQCIVGRKMFESGTDILDIIRRVRNGRISRPSRYARVDPALEAVVMKGLSTAPEDRFATALELADAIETVVAPAGQRQVGQWVRDLAGPALAEREKLIANIERMSINDESFSDEQIVGAVVNSNKVEYRRAASFFDTSESSSLPRMDISASSSYLNPIDVSATRAKTGVMRKPRRAWAAAAVLFVGGVAVAGTIGLFLRSRFPDKAASSAQALSSPAPVVMPNEDVAPEVVTSATAGLERVPVASGSVSAKAVSVTGKVARPALRGSSPALGTKGRQAPRQSEPAAPAVGNSAVQCNPPHYIDARGLKRIKPECL